MLRLNVAIKPTPTVEGEHPRRGRRRRRRLPERAPGLRRRREHRAQGRRRRAPRRRRDVVQARRGCGALYDVGGPTAEPSTRGEPGSLRPQLPRTRSRTWRTRGTASTTRRRRTSRSPADVSQAASRSRCQRRCEHRHPHDEHPTAAPDGRHHGQGRRPGIIPAGRPPSQAVLVDVGEHTGALVLTRAGRARGARGRDPPGLGTLASARTSGCCRGPAGTAPSTRPCSRACPPATTPCSEPDGSIATTVLGPGQPGDERHLGMSGAARVAASGRPRRCSAEALAQPLELVGDGRRQPVAELLEVLGDRRAPRPATRPGRPAAARPCPRPETSSPSVSIAPGRRAGSRSASRRPRRGRRSARRPTRAPGSSRRSRATASGRRRALRNQLT